MPPGPASSTGPPVTVRPLCPHCNGEIGELQISSLPLAFRKARPWSRGDRPGRGRPPVSGGSVNAVASAEHALSNPLFPRVLEAPLAQ